MSYLKRRQDVAHLFGSLIPIEVMHNIIKMGSDVRIYKTWLKLDTAPQM